MFLQTNYNMLPEDCQLREAENSLNVRKVMAHVTADLYEDTPLERYAGLIRACADYRIIRRYDGADKIETAYTRFCGARLCPICAHRRSLKMFWQLSRVMDRIDAERNSERGGPWAYILLTVTVENVPGQALQECLDRISRGFTLMARSRPWRAAIKGAWRTMEITYNKVTNEFHPHLHVLCAVNPSYFTDSTYLSQARFTDLWKRSCKLPYTPIVHVARVRASKDKKAPGTSSLAGAKAELSKYITKSMDLVLDIPILTGKEAILWLTDALQNRKSYILYGIMREAARALHLSDEDGQLLDPTDGDAELASQLRPDAAFVYELIHFNSTIGQYERVPESAFVRHFIGLSEHDLYMNHLLAFQTLQALDNGIVRPEEIADDPAATYLRRFFPEEFRHYFPLADDPEESEIEQAFDNSIFDPNRNWKNKGTI